MGTTLEDKVAAIMRATGKPVYNRMSHPAIINAKAKSPNWKMTGKPKRQVSLGVTSTRRAFASSLARNRITAGFKFVGAIDYENARTLGVI